MNFLCFFLLYLNSTFLFSNLFLQPLAFSHSPPLFWTLLRYRFPSFFSKFFVLMLSVSYQEQLQVVFDVVPLKRSKYIVLSYIIGSGSTVQITSPLEFSQLYMQILRNPRTSCTCICSLNSFVSNFCLY